MQCNDGWTALMTACRHSRNGSTEDTVKILIEAGADLNIKNNNGWTALMWACDQEKYIKLYKRSYLNNS